MSIGGILAGPAEAYGAASRDDAQSYAAGVNSNIAQRKMVYSENSTFANEEASKMQGAEAIGSIRAAYGASGITMNGTAQAVEEEQAAVNRQKLVNIQTQGALQSEEYKEQANLYNRQANDAANQVGPDVFSAFLGGTVVPAFSSTYGSSGGGGGNA